MVPAPMTVIFWAVFAATVLMALTRAPRKAVPVFATLLLAGLIAMGAGDA